ncbi:MAG: methyltransferase domain-containing protein [Rhodospirillales bacterium]|nr:methyltransferase domain-containing protein [Rhodospirillales bacterium]MDH3965883.1 methyltransferase domain-containing protein [Rhodospirillales bacterium]
MTVGDGLKVEKANWRFRGDVVDKFDEHVAKSVPLYLEGHELICNLADYFVKDGSTCYELGCSTGTLTLKLAAHNKHRVGAEFIGIDCEDDMINRARAKQKEADVTNARFEMDDVVVAELAPCDLVTAYYTVQFVRPSVRQDLINKVYNSLKWGGAFLLFEKVRANDARFQDIMSGLYLDFKLSQGYTAEEIIGKSRSLKGVLEPFSTQGNIDLLKRAGFVDIVSVSKFVCFEGFLAIK